MLAYLAAFLAFSTMAFATHADAAPITVGSPLTGAFTSSEIHNELTAANLSLEEPGAMTTSPVNGLIVRWRILDATDGSFRLRVLRPQGGTTFLGAGTSGLVTPASAELKTYPTGLPIQAGDLIGIDVSKEGNIGLRETGKAFGVVAWLPPLGDGLTGTRTPQEPAELAYNAEIQPAPTVTSARPSSGSFKGGTKVAIAGTDFTGVSAVSFGGVGAKSFTVSSEGAISAVAPAGRVGSTDITVTTIAGTSPVTTADHFKYTACVVPKLSAKKLKAAKKKLKNAGCKLGKVTKEDGVTSKTGKVVGQKPKPGKKLAPGTKVNVILG